MGWDHAMEDYLGIDLAVAGSAESDRPGQPSSEPYQWGRQKTQKWNNFCKTKYRIALGVYAYGGENIMFRSCVTLAGRLKTMGLYPIGSW
jgi:hypothetical protein